jgi:hypothetical protein
LYIEGESIEFNEHSKKALEKAVSSFLEISTTDVTITSADNLIVTKLRITIPVESAETLFTAYRGGEPHLIHSLSTVLMAAKTQENVETLSHETAGDFKQRSVSILIVADAPEICGELTRLQMNYHTAFTVIGTVDDRNEAVAIATERQPDVILLDHVLPERECFF